MSAQSAIDQHRLRLTQAADIVLDYFFGKSRSIINRGHGKRNIIAAALARAEARGMERMLYRPFPHNDAAEEMNELIRIAQELEKSQ